MNFDKLKNPGTIMALVGLALILLNALGVEVDSTKVENVALTICSALVILGIINNPTTGGVDLPFFNETTNEIEFPEKDSEDETK